jgi:hypothetical protein
MQLSSDPDPKTMNFTKKGQLLTPSGSHRSGKKLKQYKKSTLLKILTLTLDDELQDVPVQTSKQEKNIWVSFFGTKKTQESKNVSKMTEPAKSDQV